MFDFSFHKCSLSSLGYPSYAVHYKDLRGTESTLCYVEKNAEGRWEVLVHRGLGAFKTRFEAAKAYLKIRNDAQCREYRQRCPMVLSNRSVTPTQDQARAIWNLLVGDLGASMDPLARDAFIHHMTTGCTEYRFGGLTGFFTKFYACNGCWYVVNAPEESTTETEVLLALVNAKLYILRNERA